MDPPFDTNGRPWNSKRYVCDVSGAATADIRSIVDAGIWGAEISVYERKLARTRGLDPCARRASLNQFRWEKWRKSTQGRDVKTFTGRLNCIWLHDGLCDRRRCGGAFIFASRLRTQTPPYGKSLVQGRGKSIPSCRACGKGAETISHILKNRLSTTQMRIWRHNMEIDVVKDLERGICGSEQAESGISRERSIVETGTLCEEGWQSHAFGCTCPV